MGCFDYERARNQYTNNALMIDFIQGLEDLDAYHLLRDGEKIPKSFFEKYSITNAEEFKKWLSVCDGGLLFSTTLISYTKHDPTIAIDFSTFEEVNNDENIKEYGLPAGYFIIALLNYGDPICISDQDQRVFLWDSEKQYFSTVWDSLSDYLADEYNTAINMIEDNALYPIPLKEVEDGHE